MKKPIVVPSVGESITEVNILKWNKAAGEAVKPGDVLLEIESDKATVEVAAEIAGVLEISKPAGERVKIGDTIGAVDSEGKASASAPASTTKAPSSTGASAANAPLASKEGGKESGPAVRKIAAEKGVDLSKMSGSGKDGRVTKGDLSTTGTLINLPTSTPKASAPGERRVQLSRLRQTIAERLVSAQHTAAILTTFNEVDMTQVMTLRNANKDAFKSKHGVSLGFMSFFTRACAEALKKFPEVNAWIEGQEIVYHDSIDIGIAVGTDRGLVVPVLKGAGAMGFVDIEKRVAELALKARDGKLSIQDMTGGTFTITNGGVYGSLLSTPILNPPQSAILGMHKIQERPIAIQGKIEIRPMMYLALSYDHRLIDGKGAVSFLIAVKEAIENPSLLSPDF